MRVNFLLSNGVTIEQKVMTALTETETVNAEEWNVWAYRPTNVITATLTAQSVTTLQLSFTQITVVEGQQFGNTFGTVTLSVNPTIEGPEPTLEDSTTLNVLQGDISTLTTNLGTKVDEDLSGYTTLTVVDEDESYVYVYYNGGPYKVSLQDWIDLIDDQFDTFLQRLTALEGFVNQDVRTASNPSFNTPTVTSLNVGNQTLTQTKVANYDTHIASTTNPHQVSKAQLALGNVDNTSDALKPISTATQEALNEKVDTVALGVTVATLVEGKVPSNQLPSFVDDVLEYADLTALNANADGKGEETGKIYVTLDTSKVYRWSGSQYIEISPSEVTSVNTRTGAITLSNSDVGLGNVTNDAQVTSVTGTAPIVSSGGTTPSISIDEATQSVKGAMSAADKTKLDGVATRANNYVHPNHSGDVTSSGDGATTIAAKAVTLTKMDDLASNSIIGNDTAEAGVPKALTASEVRTLINVADGAQVNVDTNLGVGNKTSTTLDVTSSTGTDATIPQATTTEAGLLNGTDKQKIDHLTVTAATDLDDIRTRVGQLSSAVVLRGTWDPTTEVFPGGGTAVAGDSYIVIATDTVDGVAFTSGDRIVALVNNASTTVYANNWLKQDYTDQVSSVNTKVGAVVLDSTDIATNTSAFNGKLGGTDNTVQKALDTLDDHTHTEADITDLDKYTQAEVDGFLADKANTADLSSTIILYPTTAASDISTYSRLVDSIGDDDFDTTAVNVPTGAVSGQNVLIASLAADAGLFIGNPGVINISVVGKIRKTAGGANQGGEFYYEVYLRNTGGTETLLSTSDTTRTVTAATYQEFFASALLNNGEFTATDRIVYKFYGNNVGGGDPEFDFEFGGDAPIRALLPLPVNVTLQANKVFYDSSQTNLVATNVQGAIDEIDGLLEEGLTQVVVVKYTITDADDGTGGFTYNRNAETGITGTFDSGKFVFTLPSSIEYDTGGNRLSVKIDGDDGALKRLFYGADDELTEPSDSTFAIDYALVDDDVLYAKLYQSLATVSLAIADGSVTESKLAPNAVTESKIAPSAVVEGKIASDAVTESKIAANAVTTAKITDKNVTLAKIQDIAGLRVLGNDTGSSATAKELTVSETKTLLALNNVDNTSDANKPVSIAQAVEFHKTNNATKLYEPTNTTNSDLVLNLTNGLNDKVIITLKVPSTLDDDTTTARLSIDNGATFQHITNSALTNALGSSLTNKTVRVQYDSGNERFVVLATDEVAYSALAGLNGKEDTITGALTSVIGVDLTADRVVVTDESGLLDVSTVTTTELGYLTGVTSGIQGQIDGLALGEDNIIEEVQAEGVALSITSKAVNVTRASLGAGTGDADVAYYTTTIVGSDGSSNWVEETTGDWDGAFIATKTVSGIVDTDRPLIDLDLSAATFATYEALQTDYALIFRVEASDTNEMKFYASAEPVEDLVIAIKVVK
jgi:hypothetical protein